MANRGRRRANPDKGGIKERSTDASAALMPGSQSWKFSILILSSKERGRSTSHQVWPWADDSRRSVLVPGLGEIGCQCWRCRAVSVEDSCGFPRSDATLHAPTQCV